MLPQARVVMSATRVQLHLVLPFKHEAQDHPQIRGYLERGFRIVQLQRISDREVVVTLSRDATA